ncbi:MAG TPA: alpha-glucosidase [Geminicoccus sp.]|jgi:alpha-glucosidase|uniref:alpha-glucosidase n=1 Tax=Geminicoccus sp. TaxID=2024832 RepID=UPI002E338918|nr:alpha-glucosidase [Geminicoccus sp.]HEX2527085.1 alpha-glucosidase [Geminicoccus sp.]
MFEATTHETPKVGTREDRWWQGAVIYQIYPRSFLDTNGDGVGDLPGIERRLDHVAELGADAVWISPFMRSPMKDYGYDVADYCDVDPLFGTMSDFDRVREKAHALGLKLLIDLVFSHTSDRHPWFAESRASRDDPKADWYVWADARPDGSPPNNWLSHFGGSAWTWDPRRRQYYLHNFLVEQPQLNLWSDEVLAAVLDVARFWLDRGVDGFRLDAIDVAIHDRHLRDNPPRPQGLLHLGGPPATPFSMQVQLYNKARPELSDRVLKPLWQLTDEYHARMLLGELGSDIGLQRAAEHSAGGGLDIAYTFDILQPNPTARVIREILERAENAIGGGWMCWSLSNHDVVRAVTRFARGQPPTEALRRLIPVMLCCLRGTVCLYQGDELGLEEADLAFEDLHDPFGITFWPAFKGRDGCRTPMPWRGDGPTGGFTESRPWLPLPASHLERAVDRQAADPGSVLNHTRAFLHWRRTQPALVTGSKHFLDVGHDDVVALERTEGGTRLLTLFNLAAEPVDLRLPYAVEDSGCPCQPDQPTGDTIRLGGHGFAILRARGV